MMTRLPFVATCFCIAVVPSAVGQQVTVATPTTSLGANYSEHFGVNFGLRHVSPKSVMFFRNGGGAAFPAFGGFNPASQNTFGLRGRRGNWSWSLGLTGSQGSSRSAVTTTPMLTVPNGGFGFINSSVQRPFVTGFVPVVNDQFQAEAFRRRFEAAAAAVAEKRTKQQKEEQAELERYKKSVSRKGNGRMPDAPLVMRPAASSSATVSGLERPTLAE